MEQQLLSDFFVEEQQHWWHRAKRELIKACLPDKEIKILVLGVGGGFLCKELKDIGHYVVGVDISHEVCRYVADQFHIEMHQHDLEFPLNFEDNTFNLVIAADVIEHITHDLQLLSEIHRCLKSAGKMIITVPAYMHMWSEWDERLKHKRRYSNKEIIDRVKHAGFSVEKSSYFHLLLYVMAFVYRKLIRPLMGKQGNPQSEFSVFASSIAVHFFHFNYYLERKLLKVVDLPFGLSILNVAKKISD